VMGLRIGHLAAWGDKGSPLARGGRMREKRGKGQWTKLILFCYEGAQGLDLGGGSPGGPFYHGSAHPNSPYYVWIKYRREAIGEERGEGTEQPP
jgi:hypothetical protein